MGKVLSRHPGSRAVERDPRVKLWTRANLLRRVLYLALRHELLRLGPVMPGFSFSPFHYYRRRARRGARYPLRMTARRGCAGHTHDQSADCLTHPSRVCRGKALVPVWARRPLGGARDPRNCKTSSRWRAPFILHQGRVPPIVCGACSPPAHFADPSL
jgi:hypothetical protein